MAKTFQELSIEITQKAKAGTLTIGEAINFASNSIVPMPEGYAKNKKGEYPARNNIQTLKRSLAVLQKKAPDAFPLGENTPLKDMRQPEIVFLFRRDGSPDMANRAYNYQQFENIFFNAMRGKRLGAFSETIADGIEEEMYPRLAGSGNPMGTQRTGLAGERPMQGTLPKADLDAVYNEALPEIQTNYGEKTARVIEYHRTTFQRPEQLLNLKVSDVVVSGDVVTVKGKITTGKDHKGRPELKFKSNSPMGQLLLEALNDESVPLSGNNRSLFGVDADNFNAAFNNHVGTRLEKFSDVLPVADIKVEEGGKVIRIDQKPVTTPSAIRSIVPHYMLKDMKVNRDIVQGLMGHKPNDELGNNYAGVIVNEELPNVLQNPEAFAETGFATTKGGQVGLETDLLDDEQRAKLSEEYLDTQTAELQARTATAAATVSEMGVREQTATIERAANMPEEIVAATTVAEGEAQIAQVQSDAKQTVKEQALLQKGDSYLSKFLGKNSDTLKQIGIGLVTTAASIPGFSKIGKTAELGLEIAGAYGSTQEGASTREQLMQMGVDPTLATVAGTAKGVADFVSPVPPQPVVADSFSTRPIDRMAADSPEVAQSLQDTGNMEQPVNIPDPAVTKPQMASQGFVPVPKARANAMRGETTTMAQSFLYGGVVN